MGEGAPAGAVGEGPLFFTAATGLWACFLDNLPPAMRQHYTCNSCRHFVERFGALVSIDDAGRLTSALWADGAPSGFDRTFNAMAELVTAAEVDGVLVPATRVLGTPASRPNAAGKVWTHCSVEVPRAHAHPLLSAAQVQAEGREDPRISTRGLAEFPPELVEQALALLTSGTLYRSEKCVGVATWLLALHRALAAAQSPRRREALVWRAAATAPADYAHVRSSMIGTLLEDLAGGLDAEIKRRVEGAGGQYEGVDVRASLLWNHRNDLDLHVIAPSGEHIYFAHKRSAYAGWLDVDMNVSGNTTTPVENIRWARGEAPRGRYRVYVQNYRFHERDEQPTPFQVEVEIGGEIYHFHDTISPRRETRDASDVVVFEFDDVPGQRLAHPPRQAAPPPQGTGQWQVPADAWVPVTGVVASPNLWGDRPLTQHGRHTFFLLKGCRTTTNATATYLIDRWD